MGAKTDLARIFNIYFWDEAQCVLKERRKKSNTKEKRELLDIDCQVAWIKKDDGGREGTHSQKYSENSKLLKGKKKTPRNKQINKNQQA